MEQYDRRHGWRGPITNIKTIDWQKNIQELTLDKSLNWKLAKVISVDKLTAKIETENKEIGFIDFNNVSCVRKMSIEDFLN